MDVLLHICCGPCMIEPLRVLREDMNATVSGYFINPNIHPILEYEKRKDTLIDAADYLNIDVNYANYVPMNFFQYVQGHSGDQRCEKCLSSRLLWTAQKAKRENYSHFTTTLLVSPYQKHEHIKEMGETYAREFGIEFLYHDFRTYFRAGQQKARELELYRQKYCGCVNSVRK